MKAIRMREQSAAVAVDGDRHGEGATTKLDVNYITKLWRRRWMRWTNDISTRPQTIQGRKFKIQRLQIVRNK